MHTAHAALCDVPVPHSYPDMAELSPEPGIGTALSCWTQVPAIDHTVLACCDVGFLVPFVKP